MNYVVSYSCICLSPTRLSTLYIQHCSFRIAISESLFSSKIPSFPACSSEFFVTYLSIYYIHTFENA
ncbi:hypothetical protein HYPBUDRAFT_181134 [Hyphopichia burtonii NRRL Y-1933]|uniref:Uncharacterized protein n=1 Tax=Hyphopichia burtonii NRRL Y-1933 TaxID=984485 RepID=A0A1E4RT14_9ASCO|nr:hypothetical protein HYPBUDRAFT_181134 [Hyphopichia burtonii NRRL Y-1933]ODV70351.1 hypothetical protein HYPBUDRAFT_181134 [Hyphopichia burtonii NRRL Y-1933]